MEHTVEKLSGNKVKISFTASAEDFQQAIEKAYLKLRGQIAVPGFRKGKAPRKLIESMYGEGVFYDDAFQEIFPNLYDEAVKENDLHVVDQPEVDVKEIGEGKDLVFTCEVFVMPEVTLGDYKGVEVTRPVRKVGAEEVDNYIEQERKRVARSEEITDRALENGDKAELVGEINDVFYHMMVMMNECGVTMEDVCKEMDIRAQKIGNLKKFHVSDHNT